MKTSSFLLTFLLPFATPLSLPLLSSREAAAPELISPATADIISRNNEIVYSDLEKRRGGGGGGGGGRGGGGSSSGEFFLGQIPGPRAASVAAKAHILQDLHLLLARPAPAVVEVEALLHRKCLAGYFAHSFTNANILKIRFLIRQTKLRWWPQLCWRFHLCLQRWSALSPRHRARLPRRWCSSFLSRHLALRRVRLPILSSILVLQPHPQRE